MFSEPGCRVCVALLPEMLLWQTEYAEHLIMIPISRGEVKLNRSKFAGLGGVLLQGDREVERAYQVSATPSALLVVGGRIASSIAAGPDAIRALVARATLPPPVKKGDAVPSVKLRDLTGKATDLGTLRGHRTMLLFWNPACGFCQRMLPAVRSWNIPKNGPELVVISKGSVEDTRDQALPAKVLLDPYFSAGQVFGATGTPSAVLVDEDGLVASEVGTGAGAVFALAGVQAPEGWS
jgi:thiol-disulfide isomerase/thioredoxin